MKITAIYYDDYGKYTEEIEIAPWNICGAWQYNEELYVVSMSDKEHYKIEKEDYEKVLKYIKRREKHENDNRR